MLFEIVPSYVWLSQINGDTFHTWVDAVKTNEFLRESIPGHCDVVWIELDSYCPPIKLLTNSQRRSTPREGV